MLELVKKKESLTQQMIQLATTLGFTHPETVAKSQELDVIINRLMNNFSFSTK